MGAVGAWRVERADLAVEQTRTVELKVLAVTLALVALGVAMVFSASIPLAAGRETGDIFHYLKRELAFVAVGLAAMWVASRLAMDRVREGAWPLLVATVIALAGLFVFGTRVNGARSWYSVFGLSFQPSEMAKIVLVIAAARCFVRFPGGLPDWRSAARPFVMLAVVAGLIALQPDVGTAAVIVVSMFVYFHIAGAKLRHLVAAGGVTAIPALVMFRLHPYQWKRIIDFISGGPEVALAGGYQKERALIALGSGGLTGCGYCGSVEKYFYLPAATTDSILAVVGEELGLLFTWAVVALFCLLVWWGMMIARKAPDRFCALVAAGVTCSLGLQALLNIAVVTGSVPATGVPLPFVSYGGSSLLFSLIGVGLLLNVSRTIHRKLAWRGLNE